MECIPYCWYILSRGEQGLRGDDAYHLWGWVCGLLLLPGGLFSLPCLSPVRMAVWPISSLGSGEASLDSVEQKRVYRIGWCGASRVGNVGKCVRTGRCRSRTESQKEVRRQTTRCDKWSVVDFLVLVNVRQFAAKDVLGRDGRGKFQEGCSSVSSWGENCGTGDETVLWCRLLLLGEQKFMGLNVPKRGAVFDKERSRARRF